MYNKLFGKIVNSSIWLESDHTRIVWFTFLATMDEDGFCQFAGVRNVAHAARVPDESAAKAVATLEAPDPNSSDPENNGRRIERVPGGWIVLNGPKYRELATREQIKASNRRRAKKYRTTHRDESQPVTPASRSVTPESQRVTQSETEAYTDTEKENPSARSARGPVSQASQVSTATGESRHKRIQGMVMAAWSEHNAEKGCPWGPADAKQLQLLLGKCPAKDWPDSSFAQCLMHMYGTEGFPRSQLPMQFLPRLPSYFSKPKDRFDREIGSNGTGQVNKANDRERRIIESALRASAPRTDAGESSDPVAPPGNGRT